MNYLILFTLLFVIELYYFKIAKKFNIVDIPNYRSSHTQVTIRGGGIIFWVASFLYLFSIFSKESLFFFIGVTIISIISFIDDIIEIRPKKRILFHMLAINFAFISTNFYNIFPLWIIALSYIVLIGIINAYNFMDGINGITGLYSISVLIPLQYVNLTHKQPFVDPSFIWYPIIALIVFLFFNLRNKARCFAGDIGSVSIAFWIVTLLLIIVIKTRNLIWIGFLAVYGVDTIMTILHRIWLKQNIMEAHRLHFYQILVNECKLSHLFVSALYFITQIICSLLIICFSPIIGWWIILFIIIFLIWIYSLKFRLMRIKY